MFKTLKKPESLKVQKFKILKAQRSKKSNRKSLKT